MAPTQVSDTFLAVRSTPMNVLNKPDPSSNTRVARYKEKKAPTAFFMRHQTLMTTRLRESRQERQPAVVSARIRGSTVWQARNLKWMETYFGYKSGGEPPVFCAFLYAYP